MPGFHIPETEMRALVAHLRTLTPRRGSAPPRATLTTTEGRTLEGRVVNQTSLDLQLVSDEPRIHLLRKAGERYRPVTSQVDWPTYHGDLGGNRYSALDQIDRTNVSRLVPRWTYALGDSARLEVTPVVVDGGHVRDQRERVPRPGRGERPPASGSTAGRA